MDVPLTINTPDEPAYIFIGNLLQFCLAQHGIPWKPAPRESQVVDVDMLFNQSIGSAVIRTSKNLKWLVERYCRNIWNYIFYSSNPACFVSLYDKIDEVSKEIFQFDNAIENTYVFLAVIIEVAVLCHLNSKEGLTQSFVSICPHILNGRLPNGFLRNFNYILIYANQPWVSLTLDNFD